MKRLAYRTLSSETLALPGIKRVILPLRQTLAASPKACVTAEEKIDKGQPIAEAVSPDQASLHSPLSGTIKSFLHTVGSDGGTVAAAEIEGEFDGPVQTLEPMKDDVAALSTEALQRRLQEAGVVPMGGNGRNGEYACLRPQEAPPETLLVLCTDEEPLIQTQRQILRDAPEKVIEGGTLFQKAVGAKQLVFAVMGDQEELVSGETVLVGNRYPAGLPEILMAQVTGKYRLKEGRPRKDICLINAETTVAVRDAVREGLPVVEKTLTVSLDGGKPAVIRVPLGTPFSQVFEKVGHTVEEADRLFTGGPMRGQAQFDLEQPVTKGTDGLVLQKGKQVGTYDDVACIGCGRCIKICPMKIQVNMMASNCEYGRIQEAIDYDLDSCIECGLCAYVCIARRPLLQYIMFAKKEQLKLERLEE